MPKSTFYVTVLGVWTLFGLNAREEYIINNSKIVAINRGSANDQNKWNRSSTNKNRAYNNQYQQNTSNSKFSEYESAMMQLQEQIMKLSKIVEKNSNRIVSLEKQNTSLLENNVKLQSTIDDLNGKLQLQQKAKQNTKQSAKSQKSEINCEKPSLQKK